MNKTELVAAIAEKSGVTKKTAADMLDAFCDTVVSTVTEGGVVQLVGFGTFTSTERKGREGVNGLTGKKYVTESCRVPRFKVGKNFKDSCAAKG